MDYSIKKLPKSTVEITVTVPPEKMEAHKKKAFSELSQEIEIKGFRKGHVPPNVLEENIDKRYLEARTHELAIQRSYADAVIAEKLDVVARPKIKIEKDDPLTYVATVAVMPTMEIKDYKSIKVKKEEVKVTDKDIQEVVDDLIKYSTNFQETSAPIQKGYRAEIDFEGFDEKDQPIEKTQSKNHPLIVGEGTLIPGFEEHLIGLKKGDKKEFPITFPKDYGKKDFQSKEVKFKVEVKMVEEPSKPEFNEALIEKMTGKKQTIEEFKKDVEENIKARRTEEAKQKQEGEYIEKLLKEAKVELPDALIEEEAQYILQDVKEEIQGKGMEFGKFLEQAKTTEEQLIEKYKSEAERRLKIRMALQHIVKAEDIKVSDEELKTEFEALKTMYPETEHKKIESEFKNGNLVNQLVSRLMLKKLFDKVLA